MKRILSQDWEKVLSNQFKLDYYKKLEKKVLDDYNSLKCYPDLNNIFKAFNLCKFNDLKVVIIGQDPYHKINQANGLAFSVAKTQKIPPSLKNILKDKTSKNYLDFKRSKDFPYMRDIVIDEIYKAAKKNRDIFFATPDMGAPSLDEL